MFRFIVATFSLWILAFNSIESARVLGIFNNPSYSHQIVYRTIWKELSLRGHQVTVLTTDPINDPTLTNVTEIDLSFSYDLYNNKHNFSNIIYLYNANFLRCVQLYTDMMHDIIDKQLDHPDVKKLIEDDSLTFDLVLVEYYFPAMYAFSERFNCPMIGLTPVDAQQFGHEAIGSTIHPALFPDVSLPFGSTLNFWERFLSATLYVFLSFVKSYVVYPNGDALVAKHFGLGYRTLTEIERDVSLVFTNTNSALDNGRPLSRKIIQIGGGIHIAPQKQLPKDIQLFLDDAKEGVIYFSLGSNVKCSKLDKNLIKNIIEAFEELPYKILWSCDKYNLRRGSNIKIEKWLPQQDILRHGNIRLFITQGGYQSIEESITAEVPILGIPFFFDQHSNVKKMVEKGCGLLLDYENLTKDMFKEALVDIIENQRYRNNIKELNRLLYDQPMTGLEKAIWWTEYVIRNNGTKHLKNPLVDCPLYLYYFLDVILFVTMIIVTLVFLMSKIKWYCSISTKAKTD